MGTTADNYAIYIYIYGDDVFGCLSLSLSPYSVAECVGGDMFDIKRAGEEIHAQTKEELQLGSSALSKYGRYI